MKIFITLTILIWKTFVFAQEANFYSTDNFEVVKLNYEILDSNAVRLIQKNINISTQKFFDHHSSETNNFAYYTDNKNQWTSISLPFETSNYHIDDLKQINIDEKGQSELVIKGDSQQYGSGGGTGVGWLMIINVDSVPTQIFKIFYKCWEESFGDRQNDREGSYYNEYERKVTVSENGIIISPFDKNKYPFDGCELTEIPSGTYILDEGQIRKKK